MTDRRVLVAGATGYIGQVLVAELAQRGLAVTALVRPEAAIPADRWPASVEIERVDLFDEGALAAVFHGNAPDAVYSCIATRGGGVTDAWRVERDANLNLLAAAERSGAGRFVLLSAICVQKPRLAFQHAKLAFEAALVRSELAWTIVRPTAYFRSLAGQVERVRDGKPFLVFGNGELTACKPIGEADVARFLADCLVDPSRDRAILPIGGPGPALTPLAQGRLLCELCGVEPRFRHVPVRLFDIAAGALGIAGRLSSRLADKAEFARIGRYYATESMLLWDSERERYDAQTTPEFGTATLRDFYARVLEVGLDGHRAGEHALFERSD
ncbi:MAG: NAD(P)H-binding protein [Pseudomonadota bacterium]